MSAEGETARVYEQVFPPPQQVNGVRQGQVHRQQPPKKVNPSTPLSAEEEALCAELNLENRHFLRGKSQAKRRQKVKEIIARWKSVFTGETTKDVLQTFSGSQCLHEHSSKRKLSEHDSLCVLFRPVRVSAHALWSEECRCSILQVSTSRGG